MDHSSYLSDESYPASLSLDSPSGQFSDQFKPVAMPPHLSDTDQDFKVVTLRSRSDSGLDTEHDGEKSESPMSLDFTLHKPKRLYREKSKSSIDFVSLNKKKFPYVESKVKKYIESLNKPVKFKKQRSMPELLTTSGQLNETSPAQDDVLHELQDENQSLRLWLETFESNLTEAKEENGNLKRKIEQMRGKLHQFSERRASVPNSFFMGSTYCSPYIFHTAKGVADTSVQTDQDESEEFFMQKQKKDHIPYCVDSEVQTEAEYDDNGLDNYEENCHEIISNHEKSLLERSRSSFHRLQVSFAETNSYQVFESYTGPKGKSKKRSKLLKFITCSTFCQR